MIKGLPWCVWSWGLVACVACSETVTRPAPAGDCEVEACDDYRVPPGAGVAAGRDGAAGAGGEGGGGGMPPPQAGVLAGSVRVVTEPDLSGNEVPDEPVQVGSTGAQQTLVSVDADADGTFRLEGVMSTAPLWVAVGALEGSEAGRFMTTLQAVDSTQSQFVELLLVPRALMAEIASASYLINPRELEPGRGHAIITFVGPNGSRQSGVQIIAPDADDAAVAYDAGDIYSDASDRTATRGTAILLNMPASAYPGSTLPISAELAGVTYDTPIRVARDAVTIVEATIGAP